MIDLHPRNPDVPLELLELKDLLEPAWPELRIASRRSFGGLVCEGEGAAGGEGGSGEGGEGGEGEGGEGGEAGEGEGGDELAKTKADLAAARKAAADKDKELRDRKRADEERERQEREAGGKFDELYKAERERADGLEKENADLKKELEAEKGERKTDSARSLVLDALEKEGVRNPRREVVHIDLSQVDGESAAKRAATKFAKENPDLIDKAPTRQKRGAGANEEDEGGDDDGKAKGPIGPARLRRHFAGQQAAEK